ncbi:penicillin-binding protein 1A [Pseudomonas sp. AN-1]|uniref:penicillin-binding protein 1A n=1 Tax=Pseudomonas sp. AN-1 TaxID=3096605 RepID=UPI002A6AEA22|nr:penicillin-binding protein 1A [Pseudomonas sp. AN-1]WPP45182.1 penicillin-binding protein 1A [Pseudomonas sp. AN-1]
MRLLKLLSWTCVALLSALLLGFSGTFLYLSPGLPSVETLRNVRMQVPLRVYSADAKLIAEFGEMRRSPIAFADIPQDFIDALLAAEDDNFARHHGIDVKSLMRAAAQLLKSGQIQTGGSTITMQVAKNFFLSNERSFSRKINEILLALQIERALGKNEILELYVNKIYLGNRAYGIEAAAQIYYGKPIGELSLAQLAMIAGLPKAPSRYNPVVNPERAKIRRDWILSRMHELGKIDLQRYQSALAEPVEVRQQAASPPELEAPYVAEMARAEIIGRFGSDAYTEGYRVHTTVSSRLQSAANQALRDGLIEYDQRHGYRGPEQRLPQLDATGWLGRLAEQRTLGGLEPAIVSAIDSDGIRILTRGGSEEAVAWDTMRWARPRLGNNSLGRQPSKPADVVQKGDLIRVQRQADGSLRFAQLPQAQGALVSLDPADGAIRALIGGFAFEQSNYNRATQAKRQPGSSFKPFVYSAALDKGFTAASLINDAPIEFVDPYSGEVWRPKNDNNTFLGPIRMREALFRSRNLVSIRLLQEIGIDYALDYGKRFGLPPEELPRNFSLALGTANLTPLEVTTGYAVFANGGYRVQPYLITRIDDRDGKTLYQANPPRVPGAQEPAPVMASDAAPTTGSPQAAPAQQAQRAIDARTAYIMTSMLQDVINRGTGRRALSLGRSDLAGKTGTTNEQKDSWFAGYNGDFVTTAWAGFDQPQSLGRHEYGGTVALPIWIRYMDVALKDRPMHLPPEPEGLLRLRIDPTTGRAAAAGASGAFFELFNKDAPPQPAQEVSSDGFRDQFGSEPAAVPIDLF